MSRNYGQIQTGFWTHPAIRNLSRNARLVLVYLLTCRHSTGLGCYQLPLDYAAADLRMDPDVLSDALTELAQAGRVRRCERTEYVLILGFLRWNPVHGPKVAKPRIQECEAIPSAFSYPCELAAEIKAHGGKHFSVPESLARLCKPCGNGKGIDTLSDTLSDTHSIPSPARDDPIRTDPNRSEPSGSESVPAPSCAPARARTADADAPPSPERRGMPPETRGMPPETRAQLIAAGILRDPDPQRTPEDTQRLLDDAKAHYANATPPHTSDPRSNATNTAHTPRRGGEYDAPRRRRDRRATLGPARRAVRLRSGLVRCAAHNFGRFVQVPDIAGESGELELNTMQIMRILRRSMVFRVVPIWYLERYRYSDNGMISSTYGATS